MLSSKRLSIGLEAIQVQSDVFFKELTLAFHRLRSEKAYEGKALDSIGVAAIIKRHTGLTVDFKVDKSNDINAYVIPPMVDKNNPLIYDWWKPHVENTDVKKYIKAKRSDIIKGSVDLARGRVDGIFSEIVHQMFIHKGLIETNLLSDEEKAAICLHEVGHLFTYYEFLGHTLTTNVILHAATQAFFKSDDVLKRTQILDETCKALEIDLDDPEALVKCNSKEVFQTVVLRKAVLEAKSSLGSGIYDITATEALADQYAVRQGAGRHLATGLDKIHRHYGGGPSYFSTAVHVMATIVRVILFFALIIPTFGLIFLILLFNPAIKVYDEPEARLARMKRELVASLKDKTLPPQQRKALLDDIDAVDALLKNIDDKRGLMELFYTSVLPSGRRQYQQLRFQVELEKLVNNQLFVTAEKLTNLKFS
ncbi:hypothetical protein D3C71_435830 [compost metagenome]